MGIIAEVHTPTFAGYTRLCGLFAAFEQQKKRLMQPKRGSWSISDCCKIAITH